MQITITKKFLLIFSCILFILIAFFGVYYFIKNKNSTNVTSVLSVQNNNIPLYFPTDLPNGYSVDEQSISKAPDVSTYTISTPKSEKIFVSIQAKPIESVLEKFHTEQLGLPETIVTQIGNIVIGQVRGRYTASITPEKSWIIVTAPLSTDYVELQELVSSFEKS